MSKTVHVIAHTHWDFEWYFTQPESSVQLVYHMDDLFCALESKQIHQYILDGQLSIVEDYIALAPDNRQKLQHYVKTGQLKIGPWYTQCDQLIISGESIIRNLQLGIQSAEQFGGSWKMGYVPDAFGQSIDMPKIYAGFGIKHSVFWRGLSCDKYPWREFNWGSEDGSIVQCYQLRNGYYLAEDPIRNQPPDQLVEMIQTHTRSDHVPMPYGADQIKVDPSLSERIADYNRRSEQHHHFIESSYEALFEGIDQQSIELETIQGEMIDAQFSKIHRSIYSTRYDHKQLNDRIETRMTLILEPLMTMAAQWGIPYKQTMVNHIWKELLRNHAHDSAGGCNSDRTNRQILNRLQNADQMSEAAVDFLTQKLACSATQTGQTSPVFLFNTLTQPRTERTVLELDTRQPGIVIRDEQGHMIPFSLIDYERRYRGSIKRDDSENDPELYYFHHTIELITDLPALGWRCYQVEECANAQKALPTSSSSHASIASRRFRLTLQDGQLHLGDTLTQSCWQDFLSIRDMGDDGDNYDYSPPQHDWIRRLDFSDATATIRTSAFSQTLCLDGSWSLSSDLNERQHQQTSTEQTYHLELTLSDNAPLDIRLTIDNQACDHRMQLVIDSDIMADCSIADTPFGTVSRPHQHERINDWRELRWKEEPSCIYPLLHHVSLSQSQKTLTLFSCGIKEYEVLSPASPPSDTHSGSIALTLFRSVGWLGKPDLQRRPGIASGQQFKYIPTPDSQLLQPLSFKIGLDLSPTFDPAQLMQSWQRFAVKPLTYQCQQLNRFTNSMRYFNINPLDHTLPLADSFFNLQAPKLVCSAVKCSEAQNGVIVRLYNPSSAPVENAGTIAISRLVKQVSQVSLDEQTLQHMPEQGNQLKLGDFAPKQIKTFKFTLSKSCDSSAGG
ncbi:MAG: Mannosylglycerate hydrolase [Candidatus Celerinatantimonas neptuna]|nr:MAG: Mannosylglycerate hydrolase [Candidatus Celerinatantimonas neptuna]